MAGTRRGRNHAWPPRGQLPGEPPVPVEEPGPAKERVTDPDTRPVKEPKGKIEFPTKTEVKKAEAEAEKKEKAEAAAEKKKEEKAKGKGS